MLILIICLNNNLNEMKCPISVKKLVSVLTGILICLFLIRGVQLYLKLIYKSDFRIQSLGIIHRQPFQGDNTGMHLRKIQHRFKMENFELIEMMNETSPNMISDDALLVISASHSSVQSSYAHLLERIQKTCQPNNTLPFYLLRKARSLLMQNSKSIRQEVNQIVQVLQYFTDSLLIKRLTILSFEQGSLLTLRSIAFIKYDVFSIIDKIIVVNAFNPTTVILHGNAASFLDQTKQMILADPIRTQLTNGTRIIIIHTTDNNAGDRKINWLFKNTNGDQLIFANSLIVQSKHMWNVYSYLKSDQYFRFQPFNDLLTKLLHEDRANWPLSIKDINYLLLYREIGAPKQLNIEKRNKIMGKCVDYYMENYNAQGIFFNGECMRLLRKEDFYFNQFTTIIIRSLGKFQVYGENYQKLIPYDTKDKETVYLLENVLLFRRIFIINTRRFAIHLMIQPALRPEIVISKSIWLSNDILTENKFYYYFRTVFHKNTTEPVSLCPGQTILHPSNLTLYGVFLHQASQFSLEHQLDCYWSIDPYMSLLQNLLRHWSIGFNLIVFSLFCVHVIKKSTFSRFYYQFIVNSTLTYLHTGQYLFSENLILLAIVVLLEQILRLATFMSDMIYMPKKLIAKVMWLPVLFQILKWLNINPFISPWKALGLIFFAGTRKNNIILLFLKFTYIMQYIIRDISHTQSLFLCCAWLANSSQQPKTNQANEKQADTSPLVILTTGRNMRAQKQQIVRRCKQIIDTVTVCTIAVCLSQEGIILHYILDFYVVSYVIFAVYRQVQD